jgi:signal transduction histidine kinase
VGDKEDVRVIDCVKDVCSFLDPIAKKKDQKILFENKAVDFSIWSSRQPIQDVFYSVIGNALKFSPASTKILVSCSDDGDFHNVQVKDQGQGFTQNDLSMLFIPGNKLSAKPTGDEESTGIGLYSAKRAVEKLHGSIEINNNPDRGARVIIRFPILG